MHLPLLLALLLVGACLASVPATQGALSLNFRFSVAGHSTDKLVAYNISNNFGSMVIRGETYQAVAYYTQVMGWPNPPGSVRWIDLLGVSTKGDNLAVVYLGLPPTKPTDITMYALQWLCYRLPMRRSGRR